MARVTDAPCVERSSRLEREELAETLARVVAPIEARFGPVWLTSWLHWTDGCTRRTGAHAEGGTLDFVVADGRTRDAWAWGALNLVPRGYIGRWIYEPATASQGEHIHVAPVRDMVAAFGDPVVQILEELPDGSYVLRFDEERDGWGGPGNPIEIPGLEVTVSHRAAPWWLWLLGGALAASILTER